MEPKNIENLIRNAMTVDAMGLDEPGPELVRAARGKVMARKKPMAEEKTGGLDRFFSFMRYQLKFYQVGVSVLIACVCLFYSIEINIKSRNGYDLSNYSGSSLSIKNTTISVNSSTLLTSIPTLRN